METNKNISFGRFGRFACSSLASTGVDQLVAWTLFAVLREHFEGADFLRILLATCIARVVSMAINYTINHRMVFREGDDEPRRPRRESLPRYFLLEVGVLCLSSLGVWVAHIGYGLVESHSKLLVDFALFFLNYNGQRKWVFADRSEVQEQPAIA